LIIQRLEDLGHVTKESDLTDRRKVLVTPKGSSLQAAYKSGDKIVQDTVDLLEFLTASELKVIKKFLERLLDVHKNGG
jgi:DNA-binding MarR family transcriptional regulator